MLFRSRHTCNGRDGDRQTLPDADTHLASYPVSDDGGNIAQSSCGQSASLAQSGSFCHFYLNPFWAEDAAFIIAVASGGHLIFFSNLKSPDDWCSPSSSWSNCSGILGSGYTTPAIVFGKLELLTRLSTTAATATCPVYGSPRASP